MWLNNLPPPPPPPRYLGVVWTVQIPPKQPVEKQTHTTETERSAHKAVKSTLVSKQNTAAPKEEEEKMLCDYPWPYCVTSTEVRLLITDRDGGWGGGVGRMREWRLDRGYRPKKTGETVDRRQNTLAIAQRLVVHCAVLSAVLVTRTIIIYVRCTAVEEQPEAGRKKSNLRQPSSTSVPLLMISPVTLHVL